ncbi:hypothetical protein XM61_14480 [Acinetobacter pittii]|nr:hypothetical protein XM61_14480 [Acinetobacter pittii]
MASKEDKSLIEVLTQHQAYLYRVSSQSVNELLKIFNDESILMLAKLRDLLDELNDSEKMGEFKHEVRQFQKPYDNQQAEQISLMV